MSLTDDMQKMAPRRYEIFDEATRDEYFKPKLVRKFKKIELRALEGLFYIVEVKGDGETIFPAYARDYAVFGKLFSPDTKQGMKRIALGRPQITAHAIFNEIIKFIQGRA